MKKRLPELLAFLVATLAYARALWAEPFWDDEYLTTRNPYLASWSGVRALVTSDLWTASAKGEPSGYYRPLASLSLALNRLVGNDAASYHAGNLLIHGAVAALLVALLRRVAVSPALALVVSCAFACSPLGSEAVTWIAGRYDLLGAAFALTACILHMSDRPTMAALATLAALACKEPFVVVPGVLVLYDATCRPDEVLSRKAHFLRRYAMLAAAAALYFGARAAIGVPSARVLSETGVGGLVLGFVYVLRTLPRGLYDETKLSPFHAYARPSAVDVAVTLGVVAVLVVAALSYARARPRSRHRRLVVLGLGWALLAIAPSSITVPNLLVVGDRYAYFPLVGIAVAIAGIVGEGAAAPRAWGVAAAAVLAIVVPLELLPLQTRLDEWQTPDRLLAVTVDRDPDNFFALAALGERRAMQARFPEAEALLVAAKAREPGKTASAAQFSWPIKTALCFVYLNEARYDEGERECKDRLAEAPHDPRAWLNLASIEVNEGRPTEALDATEQALAYKPSYAEAHYVRGLAMAKLGRADEARDEAKQALAINPGHAGARALLAQLENQ